jgi:DNA repair exonuclease SbcCD ATPase subunit
MEMLFLKKKLSNQGERKMDKKVIEYKIVELKDEYLQLQHNLEKLESVKGNLHPLEKRLAAIEEELSSLNQLLRDM